MTESERVCAGSLLGTEGLSRAAIEEYLDGAVRYRNAPIWETGLAQSPVALMFMEPSTRTRFSFEMACHRLGAVPLAMSTQGTSISKGETLLDSARLMREIGASVVVLRHRTEGAPHEVARELGLPVINAGDGTHEHPTQALLDLLTMRDALGTLEGRRVAIVGDIQHSRVARSNIFALKTMGVEVCVSGPSELCPDSVASWGVTVHRDLDALVGEVDVMMMLRIQRERIEGHALPSVGEYRSRYGLTEARAARMRPHAVVLHPAPMNRGVEIDDVVADGSRSRIFEQMRNGVFVRMACVKKAATGDA